MWATENPDIVVVGKICTMQQWITFLTHAPFVPFSSLGILVLAKCLSCPWVGRCNIHTVLLFLLSSALMNQKFYSPAVGGEVSGLHCRHLLRKCSLVSIGRLSDMENEDPHWCKWYSIIDLANLPTNLELKTDYATSVQLVYYHKLFDRPSLTSYIILMEIIWHN